MDLWFHCNQCKIPFSNQCSSFVVTTCGHVFCSKCEQQATSPLCAVCQKQCSCTKLNNKTDPSIAVFFKPPSELIKKAMDLLKKADEVKSFQDNQLKLLKKSECAKIEKQKQLLDGAMQTVEQLKKENNDMKRILISNKSNICISPNSSFLMPSPDRSPHSSPSNSPRRKSPSHNQKYKQLPQYHGSVPCSPNKAAIDYQQYPANKQINQTPKERTKRVSLRSPPVDGKLYGQSPPSISPNRGHPYKTSEGIISKKVSLSPQSQLSRLYQSSKTCGLTPPTTPKYSPYRGYNSCPVTPENNKLPAFYAMMQGRKAREKLKMHCNQHCGSTCFCNHCENNANKLAKNKLLAVLGLP